MAAATHEDLVESNLGAVGTHQRKIHHTHEAAVRAVGFGSIWEKTIITVLFAEVAGTALASGAVEPWSVALFELTAVLLIILWAGKSVTDRRVFIRVPAAALPIGLLVLIGLAQSVAFGGKEGRASSLSMDVEATRSAVLALFALLACFLAAVSFLGGHKRIRFIVRCLVIYGLVMAIFALIQHLSSGGQTYWLRPQSQWPFWFGPFVNHAHFAGYMALLIPLPIALMMNGLMRGEERLLFGFAAAIMGLSLVVSLSRGGMIAMAMELVFLLIAGSLPARQRTHRQQPEPSRGWMRLKSLAVLGIIIISIGAGLLWLGPEPVVNRIARGNGPAENRTESFDESRGWIWRDSMRVFESHPLLGVGMGAFETAFPIYSKSDGSLRVSQSHNDYIQVLTDCGILGGILAIWFIIAIGFTVFRGLGSHDPFTRSISIGCGGAILGMLVHSIFDFNLQLPSTALLFLVICAIASVAGGRPHGNKSRVPAGASAATGRA